MTLATEMRTFAFKMPDLLRGETDLGILAFLYIVRAYVECFDLKTVLHIHTAQNKDDRFPLFETDGIWIVSKSLGDDFDSLG